MIPDQMWRILFDWYSDLKMYIKWNNSLNDCIQFLKGTRQGGLSFHFLFNLFYQQLIDILNCTVGGILINDVLYNVFCYADDLILTSTSMTGLQKLINCASNYIVSHGLRFNPTKTQCATFGRKAQQTGWFLGGCKLAETDRTQYLGAVISISYCRRAFYSLQSVGLCRRGTNPGTIGYLWMTVLRHVLTYGISCMNMSKKAIESLENCQTNLLKTVLGLKSYCRNTPILQAMNIKRISHFIGESQRDVMKSLIRNETN